MMRVAMLMLFAGMLAVGGCECRKKGELLHYPAPEAESAPKWPADAALPATKPAEPAVAPPQKPPATKPEEARPDATNADAKPPATVVATSGAVEMPGGASAATVSAVPADWKPPRKPQFTPSTDPPAYGLPLVVVLNDVPQPPERVLGPMKEGVPPKPPAAKP